MKITDMTTAHIAPVTIEDLTVRTRLTRKQGDALRNAVHAYLGNYEAFHDISLSWYDGCSVFVTLSNLAMLQSSVEFYRHELNTTNRRVLTTAFNRCKESFDDHVAEKVNRRNANLDLLREAAAYDNHAAVRIVWTSTTYGFNAEYHNFDTPVEDRWSGYLDAVSVRNDPNIVDGVPVQTWVVRFNNRREGVTVDTLDEAMDICNTYLHTVTSDLALTKSLEADHAKSLLAEAGLTEQVAA